MAFYGGGKASCVGKQGRTLTDDSGHAHGKGRGNEVRLPGDPARISHHVQCVFGGALEYGVHGVGDPCQPGAVGMHDALGFAGRARGINDEQGPIGLHRDNRLQLIQRCLKTRVCQRPQGVQVRALKLVNELLPGGCHQVIRVDIPVVFDHFLSGVPRHHHVLDIVAYPGQFNRDFGT